MWCLGCTAQLLGSDCYPRISPPVQNPVSPGAGLHTGWYLWKNWVVRERHRLRGVQRWGKLGREPLNSMGSS